MENIPLFFRYTDTIESRAFTARVETLGRILARAEDGGGIWIDGVNPGAIAEGGPNPTEALGNFRRSYREVLEDLAETNASIGSFRRVVEEWVHAFDAITLEEWLQAVARVRSGEVVVNGFPKRDSQTSPSVSVVEVSKGQAAKPEIQFELETLAA